MAVEVPRREKNLRRVVDFTDEELRDHQLDISRPGAAEEDVARHTANLVEIRKELAGAKDPKVRAILTEELNRLQGSTNKLPLMQLRGPATPTVSNAPLMDFRVFGREDTGPNSLNPNAPQFGETNTGAVTGIERPRRGGEEPATPFVGPAEKRLGTEAAFAAGGAVLGGMLGGAGEPLGAGLGATLGSLVAEIFDPTEHPALEAVTTGAFATATAGLSTFGAASIRAMLGKPSSNGEHLLSILEAAGKVPTAGAVLEGSLAKNMQAIGSSDAFFGKRVQEAVKADGNVVTDRVRTYISGYQRYYGGAKEGFNIFDQAMTGRGALLNIDRGILDKLKRADAVWKSEGAEVDFPLRKLLDDVAAAEAAGGKLTSVPVSFGQAEAVRQLLYQRAKALSGTARSEGAQAVGEDVAKAVRDAASKLGDDIDEAIDLAVKNKSLPAEKRAILHESREMWKQWRIGEVLQDELADVLKLAGRSGEPITSSDIFSALKSIDQQQRKLRRPIIGASEEAHLMGMAKALQANETAQHSTQFTMAVRSGQLFTLSGAGFAGASGNPGVAATALSVTLVPAALGWMVRSPKASALLIRGLRLQPGSAAAVRTANQLATMLVKEGFLAPVERSADSADQP